VEMMGLEPTTPCLQSRCSSRLSYIPETSMCAAHRHTLCLLACAAGNANLGFAHHRLPAGVVRANGAAGARRAR